MSINLIAAVDEGFGIGYNNDLLIKISEDLKYFKRLTLNNVVIMGRKTFESLPGREPLKKRENIIITRDRGYKVEGAVVCHGVAGALKVAESFNKEVFVIGGETIYRQFLPYCQKAFITRIYHRFEADKYMPDFLSGGGWKVIEESEMRETDGGIGYRFVVYSKEQ